MRIRATLLTALCVLLLPALAAAQDFPDRPIKLIVPFPAGGPNDIIARVVGQRMSELLKQPVLIDNRGGAGGVLGTDALAKAKPDGYTIAVTSAGALVISPSMEKVSPRYAEGFAAHHPGRESAGNAGGRHQRSGNEHEGAGCPQGQPENSILHRPARAACRIWRGVAEAHGENRYRACTLSRRRACHQRPARPAGADDVPRPAGDPSAHQGRYAAADRARRARACADRARRADHGRSRHAGSLDRELVGMLAPAGTPAAVVATLNRAALEAMRDPDVKEKLATQGARLDRRHAGALPQLHR